MLVCTRVCVIFSTPSSNPARVMTDIATLPRRKLAQRLNTPVGERYIAWMLMLVESG